MDLAKAIVALCEKKEREVLDNAWVVLKYKLELWKDPRADTYPDNKQEVSFAVETLNTKNELFVKHDGVTRMYKLNELPRIKEDVMSLFASFIYYDVMSHKDEFPFENVQYSYEIRLQKQKICIMNGYFMEATDEYNVLENDEMEFANVGLFSKNLIEVFKPVWFNVKSMLAVVEG